jgi:ATP-dependent RNA helicase RhlE
MMETQTFEGLGIAPRIMEVLRKLRFTVPTPIQRQAIPVAMTGSDVIGIAQTGTGKTLAFGIPTIQRLMTSQGTALIILPTRELALQVDESLENIGRNFNISSAVLIGGQNMEKQIRQLKNNPRLIISTPGRLIDHLERKTVRLNSVEILILDEADRMLDMGFEPQIKRILQSVPEKRQTMLFSATMPTEIIGIANRYMKTPLRVEVAPAGSATENVTHEIFFVKEASKMALLETILKEHSGSVLIFSRTKHGAKRITRDLLHRGYNAAEIHSNRTLAQRMRALEGFKKGKFQVLVATDIAARGIDVKGIELVINYDLPDQPEDYVHRIGRTGRADALGHAISFATPKQAYDVRTIEKLIKKELPVSELPESLRTEITQSDLFSENRNKSRGSGMRRNFPPSRSHRHSASGNRYAKRSRPEERKHKPGEDKNDNPKREFLPQKRRGKDLDISPIQKGRNFYDDFETTSIFKELASGETEKKKDSSLHSGYRSSNDRQKQSGKRKRNDKNDKHDALFRRDARSSDFINHGSLSSENDEFMTPDEVHNTFNSFRKKNGGRGAKRTTSGRNNQANRQRQNSLHGSSNHNRHSSGHASSR